MSTKSASQIDLAKVFSTVTRELKNNQQALNASDEYNHNHGDNMVENFQVITRAMRQTKGSAPSDQLAYASQVLSQRSHSGSAQLYSQGLANAADQMRGQSLVTPENAMLLVQALLGGQAGAAQPQANPWQAAQPAQQDQAGGDLLGSLLGSFMGGAPTGQTSQPQAGQSGGIDLNTLLTAGMAFFQARQQGAEPLQALAQAAMAGSQMQGTTHHSQSGQLVAQTLINSLGKMLSGRK